MRHFLPALFFLFASLFVFSLTGALAQCEAGEVAIEFVIDTDPWGYELYWELTPTGEACGGENFIASGGNSANVVRRSRHSAGTVAPLTATTPSTLKDRFVLRKVRWLT